MGIAVIRYSVVPPHSVSYFCRECGRQWAKVRSPGMPWLLENRLCSNHAPQPGWAVDRFPGTVCAGLVHEHLVSSLSAANAVENLPLEVLKREAEMLFAYLDKELEKYNG